MKLRVSQGVCRGSETSPMMGSTPYRAAAPRTCPSSVASLRGRETHGPADSRVVQCDTTVFITSVWGGARESQSGFPDGVGWGWSGGWSSSSSPGRVLQRFVEHFIDEDGGFSRRGRPCDLQRQVPAVPLLWRGGAPASVHRQSG